MNDLVFLFNLGFIDTLSVTGVVTNYYLNGDQVVSEITGTNRLNYFYDENGNLFGFTYNNTSYYYIRNGQSDIIGILDTNGNQVVTYSYDTWGKLMNTTGSLASTVGAANPYRYRGYRYDTESGLFYVGSRYYNPEWGRFLNADGLVSTGQGLLGNNMFAYCGNNPVNNMDPSGNLYERTPNINKKWGVPAPITQPPYSDHPQAIEESTELPPTDPVGAETVANDAYFVVKPETTIDNVDSTLMSRLRTMGEDYGQSSITISEGFRTAEQQQYFRDLYLNGKGNPANPVGYSWHEYGGAVDIVVWDFSLQNSDFEKYGLCRPASTEPWHIQIIENSFACTNPTDGLTYYNSITRRHY